MDWLGRRRRAPPPEAVPDPVEETSRSPVERAAPGVAATFAGLEPDGSHAILDLGTAVGENFRLLGGYARRIRFAGILPNPPHGKAWSEALRSLPPLSERPYDLVLGWNLLDRLIPEERPPLVRRLAELTAPGARLYVVVDVSGSPTIQPIRFTLLGLDRVQETVVGPPRPAQPPLLPAAVERLLEPFQVVQAFTLRRGLREYAAIKRGGPRRSQASDSF